MMHFQRFSLVLCIISRQFKIPSIQLDLSHIKIIDLQKSQKLMQKTHEQNRETSFEQLR